MSEKTIQLIDNYYLREAQLSVRYAVGSEDQDDNVRSKLSEYYSKSDCHMLIEDVASSILPMQIRSGSSSVKIYISPTDAQVEQFIIQGLKGRSYGRDLIYPLHEFFRFVAHQLLVYGTCHCEIVCACRNHETSDGDTAMGMHFELIPPGTVSYRKGKYIQVLPRGVAERLNIERKVQLPERRVVVFALSNAVQKQNALMLERLSFHSDHVIPEIALAALKDRHKKVPYDYVQNARTRQLALAESTKATGYNRRNSFEKEMTEYYFLRRELTFEKFKIEIRNTVHTGFNEILRRAGKELGFSAQLEIEGLPNISDVKSALEDLEKGSKPFNEIMKPFVKVY